GTTVVRALEHAAETNGVLRAGEDLATQRIGRETRLRIVDAIVSGTHEPGTSHYELLRAFVTNEGLEHMNAELEEHGYRTHEFGDWFFGKGIDVRAASVSPRNQTGTPLAGAFPPHGDPLI